MWRKGLAHLILGLLGQGANALKLEHLSVQYLDTDIEMVWRTIAVNLQSGQPYKHMVFIFLYEVTLPVTPVI